MIKARLGEWTQGDMGQSHSLITPLLWDQKNFPDEIFQWLMEKQPQGSCDPLLSKGTGSFLQNKECKSVQPDAEHHIFSSCPNFLNIGLICCWINTAKSPNCTGAKSSWSPWETTSGMTRPWSGISSTPTTRSCLTTWILTQRCTYKWGLKNLSAAKVVSNFVLLSDVLSWQWITQTCSNVLKGDDLSQLRKTLCRMKNAAVPLRKLPGNLFCDICLAAPSGPVWHSLRLLQRRVQGARSGPGIQTCWLPGSEWRFFRLCRSRGPLLDGLFHLPALLQEYGPCDRVASQVGKLCFISTSSPCFPKPTWQNAAESFYGLRVV